LHRKLLKKTLKQNKIGELNHWEKIRVWWVGVVEGVMRGYRA